MSIKKVRCPRCREWANWQDNPYRPFCSEACKLNDLGKWANEEYRVPVEEADSGEGQVEPKVKDEE